MTPDNFEAPIDLTDQESEHCARRVRILGQPVDLVRVDEAKAEITRFLEPSARVKCHHVVTINPEYIMAARRDPEFAVAIERADLIVADGVGVIHGVRLLQPDDRSRIERFTGVDIVEWLVVLDPDEVESFYLLGAEEEIVTHAIAALRSRNPAFRVAGQWSGGSAASADDDATNARLREARPSIVLVAYGAPGQVIWIDRNREQLADAGVRLAIGVGGAFDYLSGEKPRASGAVRSLGLEWLARLVREPWRWRRQLALPQFVLLVFRDKIALMLRVRGLTK